VSAPNRCAGAGCGALRLFASHFCARCGPGAGERPEPLREIARVHGLRNFLLECQTDRLDCRTQESLARELDRVHWLRHHLLERQADRLNRLRGAP